MAIEIMLWLVIDALHHLIHWFISWMTNRSIRPLGYADIWSTFASWKVLVDRLWHIPSMWMIDHVPGLLGVLKSWLSICLQNWLALLLLKLDSSIIILIWVVTILFSKSSIIILLVLSHARGLSSFDRPKAFLTLAERHELRLLIDYYLLLVIRSDITNIANVIYTHSSRLVLRNQPSMSASTAANALRLVILIRIVSSIWILQVLLWPLRVLKSWWTIQVHLLRHQLLCLVWIANIHVESWVIIIDYMYASRWTSLRSGNRIQAIVHSRCKDHLNL